MKINGITATDYRNEGDQLTLWLSAENLDQITAMPTDVLRVETDSGDLVECFAGYALASVLYDAVTDAFCAELTRDADGSVKRVYDALTAQLETSERKSKLLEAQLQAQSDRSDFIEDCIAEMAVQVYSV